MAVLVALALPGHVRVTVGVAVLGAVTGVVAAAVGASALGVDVACGHPVDRESVGAAVGVQLDGAVAVGCGVRLGNGHHVGHQLGVGEAV